MLKAAYRVGFRNLVATPHLYRVDETYVDKVERAFQTVQPVATALKLRIRLGYEVNWRVLSEVGFDRLGEVFERFHIGGTRHMLVELPVRQEMVEWQNVLSELAEYGTPVIVHPERFSYIQEKPEKIREMITYGCEIQVDASSLDASIFSPVRRTAEKLMKQGWVHYFATDAHRVEEYAGFMKMRQKYQKHWIDSKIDDILPRDR